MRKRVIVCLFSTLFIFACAKSKEKPIEHSTENPDYIESPDADLELDSEEGSQLDGSEAISYNPIAAARKYAEGLLGNASKNVSGGKDLYQTMQGALTHATIRVAKKGKSYKECVEDPAVLAFVMSNHPNTIHVCPRAAVADRKSLAQVLIHETAHVVGIYDECKATQVEVVAMRGSGANLAFKNGYMNRCKIR